MTTTIKFGTEGWRAVMAEEFTAQNVRIVAQAIAEYVVKRHAEPVTVAVGHDTRFLSDYFATTACEVLAGNGIRSIVSTGAVPTCAVSRYVVANRLPLGIVITASHNPGRYNGMKVKESYGGSATNETVAAIEQHLGLSEPKRLVLETALKNKLVRRADMMPLFLRGIASFIDVAAIRRSKLRVIVDSMHGTGGRIIERLLSGGRCRVETLHPAPDAWFGGHAPEPIASNLDELMGTVKRTRADLGIANDGDADRLGIIGPGGAWLNPGQMMCVMLQYLIQERRVKGAIVKTVSNTMMINRMAEALGVALYETPVGFKHIAKLMLSEDVAIGGEESGGIGVKGYLPERDGIVNGLLVLEAMAVQKKSLTAILRELQRQFGEWHYGRRDLHLTMPQVDALFARLKHSPPETIAGVPVASVNTMDGVKLIGRDESWMLFRRSGTEPIVRIYAETPKKFQLPRLLTLGVRVAADSKP
ncbi:MAG: phosphoglucomutase/phosphomannomutase family protein [Candidatus Omnitrophica bacterium]|nr:phosphoglucomutase/phosphomannomutase family protein [Candidatus Omnitrophota bacterium]